MKKPTKITKLSTLIMLGALAIFSTKALLAHAQTVTTQAAVSGATNQEMEHHDDHHGDDDQGDDGENEDGQNNDEHDIFALIAADHAKAPKLNLPDIDEKSIQTYADVVAVLKSDEAATAQLSAAVGIDTSTATLTAGERSLLDRLLNKHQGEFTRLNRRITEVNTQLKQLEDLLSPLGTAPISSMYGIRGLLINELKNYREIIIGLSEFDSLNSQILQGETE